MTHLPVTHVSLSSMGSCSLPLSPREAFALGRCPGVAALPSLVGKQERGAQLAEAEGGAPPAGQGLC